MLLVSKFPASLCYRSDTNCSCESRYFAEATRYSNCTGFPLIPVLSFLFSWKNIHSEKAQGEVENYLCCRYPELIEDRLRRFPCFSMAASNRESLISLPVARASSSLVRKTFCSNLVECESSSRETGLTTAGTKEEKSLDEARIEFESRLYRFGSTAAAFQFVSPFWLVRCDFARVYGIRRKR